MPHDWFSVGQWVIGGAITALVTIFITGWRLGKLQAELVKHIEAVSTHVKTVDARVVEVERISDTTIETLTRNVSETKLIAQRMDQAGDLLSKLTSKMTELPNQGALTAVWRELGRMADEQREDQRHMARMLERLSFLEGQRNGKPQP